MARTTDPASAASESSSAAAASRAPKRGLGRGLEAIFGEAARTETASRTVPIGQLTPSPFQPRKQFEPEALASLAQSITQRGVLQPLLVRAASSAANLPGGFEIIAGERRWRAAQAAGLAELPVRVLELADHEVLEVALVENLQREDLDPIDEAEGYQRLMDEFNHTQEVVAGLVGRSRPHIANLLRLLSLPQPVQHLVREGALSAGHARALITVPDPVALAQKIVRNGLSVRATEKLAAEAQGRAGPLPRRPTAPTPAEEPQSEQLGRDHETIQLEHDLSSRLGMKVRIDIFPDGGAIRVEYRTLDQFDELLHRLTRPLTHD